MPRTRISNRLAWKPYLTREQMRRAKAREREALCKHLFCLPCLPCSPCCLRSTEVFVIGEDDFVRKMAVTMEAVQEKRHGTYVSRTHRLNLHMAGEKELGGQELHAVADILVFEIKEEQNPRYDIHTTRYLRAFEESGSLRNEALVILCLNNSRAVGANKELFKSTTEDLYGVRFKIFESNQSEENAADAASYILRNKVSFQSLELKNRDSYKTSGCLPSVFVIGDDSVGKKTFLMLIQQWANIIPDGKPILSPMERDIWLTGEVNVRLIALPKHQQTESYLQEVSNLDRVIILVDVSNKASFQHAKCCLQMLYREKKEPVVYFVINKIDLLDRSKEAPMAHVSGRAEMQSLVRSHGGRCYEISASNEENVDTLLGDLSRDLQQVFN